MTLDELRERALRAGYEAELADIEIEAETRQRLFFGKSSREDDPQPRVVLSEEHSQQVGESRFDEFQILDDFEAIWSPALGVIECALDAGTPALGPAFYTLESLARRLSIEDGGPLGSERDFSIEIPPPRDDLRIRLQNGSLEYMILRPLFGRRGPFRLERMPRVPVIRIEGFYATSAEIAGDFLERLGNAVLFQLDLSSGIPLFLSRPAQLPPARRRASTSGETTLRPPKFEYDGEAMALYWYGRTAFQMPLLQFLAFYQAVEYYFPMFSEIKVRDTIQRLLKDPRFDPTHLPDVTRLIAQIKPSRSGRGFGDEKAQLQATIQECITPEEMREFLEADERRSRFYDRPSGKRMPVVPVKVPIGSDHADLRPNVAERLYAIRCRIVHTKAGDDATEKILLPFSREAMLLRIDTDLMEYVVRQVIIATSQPLRLD